MSVRRVAVIFDNTGRPETTGLYCRRALGCLVEVEHFLPSELDRVPRCGFDLYFHVDDGLDYALPPDLRPAAFWAIDTHIDADRARAKARTMDFVFAAQRDGARQLCPENDNCWLPLACDPLIHRKHDLMKTIDVCFVGNVFPGPRQELLEQIQRRFSNTFVGRRYLEHMARTYSASKIVFNRSVQNDINMRVFEALACGSLLLTNDLSANGQADLFQSGVHFDTYACTDELLDKIAHYLVHDDLRERIAVAGHNEALSRHSYLHRMVRMLRSVEKQLARRTVRLPGGDTPLPSRPDVRRQDSRRMSACLLSWKRPDNVRRIVEALRAEPLIDDIVVWNNDPTATLELSGDNVRVINAPRNLVTYGRYLCARHARHDLIYTQDDDCLVHNIGELYESFRLDPTCISHGLKLGHLLQNAVNVFDGAQVALVGWGAVFKKEWADFLASYISVYGEDDLLIRKADRIFSLLLDRRHRSIPAVVTDLPGVDGPEALSVQSDHLELTREAISRVLAIRNGAARLPVNSVPDQRCHTDPHEAMPPESRSRDHSAKSQSYFEHARPELLSMLSTSARRVLDIGCGAGVLGASIKQRHNAEVWGIERDASAAEVARGRLDQVIVADIEDCQLELDIGRFDAIICGDVLEHLRDPGTVLNRLRTCLAPDGQLIASIPNVRHRSVVLSLLKGNWTYESAGLLDEDHVRFFTRREIEKLFYRAGFSIKLRAVADPSCGQREAAGKSGAVRLGHLHISDISPQEAQEFYIYQYLVDAHPEDRPDYGLTSIVIVTYNELRYTQPCIDSIRQFTDEPYEFIFVDNGSTDGTPEFLHSLSNATVIENESNRGFPAAVNQGIQVAKGRQILLLNNDVIVTTGWLRRLLDALYDDPQIGLVGPCSNSVSGQQQVPVSYEDLAELDGFAWDWSTCNRGERIDTDRLVGFCILIRRAVVDDIGLLDERFGVGCFEDDDYSRRALQAGYRPVIARDAFVHHFGSRTFRGSGIDLGKQLQENERRYHEKWADAAPAPTDGQIECRGLPAGERPPFIIAAGATPGLLLAKNNLRLSLCMIVRDNENTIRPCLESIAPWVDEMIVVDTGSVDDTPLIAEELGARVFHFPWCDDFSAARNQSLNHARGEWIFWMDSDDTINEDCGRRLRELACVEHTPDVLGYIMQVHCPGSSGSCEMTIVDHVKLFRNRPDLRFEMRIHEQIIPAIRRAGGEVAWTDLFVVHSGSDQTAPGRQRKLERDFRILQRELAERPDHPFVLFNLGMTHHDAQQYEQAVSCLIRSIQVSKPNESHLRKAYALLLSAYAQTSRLQEASDAIERALALFPGDTELLFRKGAFEHQCGRLEEAEHAYLRALETREPRHLTSVVVGLDGHLARHNLALVYEDMAQLAKAREQWESVVAQAPHYSAGWQGLGNILLAMERYAEVRTLVKRLREQDNLRGIGAILSSRLLARQGDTTGARRELEEASQDAAVLEELGRLLFDSAGPVEAEPVLRRLTEVEPTNASAHHNLGTVLFQRAAYEQAAICYERSAALRPKSPVTWLQWGSAFAELGRRDDATRTWREGLQHSPGDQDLIAALQRIESANGNGRS